MDKLTKNNLTNTITVKDNRNNKEHTFPITNNFILASDIGKLKDANNEPTRSYDPAYMNTICCVSF